MTFNNVDLYEEFGSDEYGESYFLVNNVTGRGVMDVEAEGITATQMDGVYPSFSRYKERILGVDFTLKGEDFEDLRKKLERLNEIFSTRGEEVPIEFDDEPNRVYRGRLTSAEDSMENGRIYQASIMITCGNPHKRGKEPYEKDFEDDSIIVENEGTALAEPIFELTAKEKATFAMVANGTNEDSYYNLIGVPADDDVEVVDARDTIYKLDGMDGWSPDGVQPDSRWPDVVGSMQYDGTGMRPNSFGSGDKIHGPGVIRELDENVQDFEIDAIFDVISERDPDNFRLEITLFDENMDTIGMIGIKDNTYHDNVRIGLGRVGPYRGSGADNGYMIGEDNYTMSKFSDNTLMHMKMRREGDEFYFKIGRWRVNRLNDVLEETYKDSSGEFQGKLKYVQVLIGSWGDRLKPARVRINKIDVVKLHQVEEDQTPYIIYPGDLVTFDHEDDEILINGEPRDDLKNFGGTFFPLHKGTNEILVYPDDTFDTKVRFENKYL